MLTGLGFAIAVVNAAIPVLFAMGRSRPSRPRSPACPAADTGRLDRLRRRARARARAAIDLRRRRRARVRVPRRSGRAIHCAQLPRREHRGHPCVPAPSSATSSGSGGICSSGNGRRTVPVFLVGDLHPRAHTLADLLPFAALGWLCLGAIAVGVLRARRQASFETLGRVFMPATDSQGGGRARLASRSTSRPRGGI